MPPALFVRSQYGHSGATGTSANTTDTEELLKIAKDNIKNLKQRGRMVLYILLHLETQYSGTFVQGSSSHIDDLQPNTPKGQVITKDTLQNQAYVVR